MGRLLRYLEFIGRVAQTVRISDVTLGDAQISKHYGRYRDQSRL
jgi:hypothetical protein